MGSVLTYFYSVLSRYRLWREDYDQRDKLLRHMLFWDRLFVHFDLYVARAKVARKVKRAAQELEYDNLPEEVKEKTSRRNCLIFSYILILSGYFFLLYFFDFDMTKTKKVFLLIWGILFVFMVLYAITDMLHDLYLKFWYEILEILLDLVFGIRPKENTAAYHYRMLFEQIYTVYYTIFWVWALSAVTFYFETIPYDHVGWEGLKPLPTPEELQAHDDAKLKREQDEVKAKYHKEVLDDTKIILVFVHTVLPVILYTLPYTAPVFKYVVKTIYWILQS